MQISSINGLILRLLFTYPNSSCSMWSVFCPVLQHLFINESGTVKKKIKGGVKGNFPFLRLADIWQGLKFFGVCDIGMSRIVGIFCKVTILCESTRDKDKIFCSEYAAPRAVCTRGSGAMWLVDLAKIGGSYAGSLCILSHSSFVVSVDQALQSPHPTLISLYYPPPSRDWHEEWFINPWQFPVPFRCKWATVPSLNGKMIYDMVPLVPLNPPNTLLFFLIHWKAE